MKKNLCNGAGRYLATAVSLTDSNVNVLIIIMENIVNMNNFVSNIIFILFISFIIFSL